MTYIIVGVVTCIAYISLGLTIPFNLFDNACYITPFIGIIALITANRMKGNIPLKILIGSMWAVFGTASAYYYHLHLLLERTTTVQMSTSVLITVTLLVICGMGLYQFTKRIQDLIELRSQPSEH